jgi:beta-galactosidase
MKLGVCYYPEHWPQERWPEDARLMRQAGLSLVRLADFAWALMEPKEGELNWDWLDRAIEILAAEGLQVILCTPTASPPAWLCRAFPEILR